MLSLRIPLILFLAAFLLTSPLKAKDRINQQDREVERSLRQNVQRAEAQDGQLAGSLSALADFYSKYPSKLDEAETLYRQSLDLQGKATNLTVSERIWTLVGLANVQREKHKYRDAEDNLRRALVMVMAPHNATTQGFHEIKSILNKVVVDSNNGQSMFDSARVLDSLAELYFVRGNIRDAKLLYDKVLQIYDCPDNADMMRITTNACLWPTDTISKTLTNLAVIYARQGKVEQAQRRLQQAVDVSKILAVPQSEMERQIRRFPELRNYRKFNK